MKLYHAGLSTNSYRTRSVAFHLGLNPELIDVDLMKGEQRAPEFLRLNPNGKVPVLDDDGFVLWESRAICAYLDEVHGEGRLTPAATKPRFLMEQWVQWQAVHLGPGMSRVIFERALKPRFGMGQPDESRIESAAKDLDAHLDVLEQAISAEGFVGTPQLSLADFAVIGTFSFLAEAQIELTSRPKVHAWLARMEALPGVAKAAEPMVAFARMQSPAEA